MPFVDPDAAQSGFVDPDAVAHNERLEAKVSGKVPLSQRAKIADVGDLVNKASYALGGAATDVAAKVLPPEGAAAVGTVANIAGQAAPMLLGGGASAASDLPLAGGEGLTAAQRLMHSALKPGVKMLRNDENIKAINTMLDEGINVTPGGLTKLRNLVSKLNKEIMTTIRESPASVDKVEVTGELLPTLHKFKNQVNPGADVATIKSAWQEFLEHPSLPKLVPEHTVESAILNESGKPFTSVVPASGSNAIPVQTAQELKQGTYRVLAGKYGEQGSASTEAQKALARGLKEGIANAVPEVAGLNARESKLLNVMEPLERRLIVEMNKNPAGLSLLAGHPGAWAAFMADRSSAFKSVAARMLNSMSKASTAPLSEAAIGVPQAMRRYDEQ